MHFVYCAQCGTKLPVARKALSRYATIINLVPVHSCPEKPVEIDLAVDQSTPYIPEGEFVKDLEAASPPPKLQEPGDRRSTDFIKKTTAPTGLSELFDRFKLPTPSEGEEKDK